MASKSMTILLVEDNPDDVVLLEEREKLIDDLHKAMDEIKTLSGLIPICANCKRIRNDKGYWEQWEAYISVRSQAQFLHGICPQCVQSLYNMDVEDKPGVPKPALPGTAQQ